MADLLAYYRTAAVYSQRGQCMLMLCALGELDLALLSIHVIILVIIVKPPTALSIIILQLQSKLISEGVAAAGSTKQLLLVSRICVVGLVSLHRKRSAQAGLPVTTSPCSPLKAGWLECRWTPCILGMDEGA